MRIAVIADIHGNSAALDAVLADLAGLGADLTVNLGDCFSGPLDAAGTAERLFGASLPTLAGNHDRWLIDRPIAEMGRAERQALAGLGPAALDWLRALPATLTIEGVLFCHGTPRADDVFWLDRPRAGRMELASREEIEAEAVGAEGAVILCGHTHVQRTVRLADGRLVVNPGSVGVQAYADRKVPRPYGLVTGSPDARYAVIERSGGTWRAELRSVRYDPAPMVALAEAAGEPDWAAALATGWVDL